uniref:cell division protein ZapA n=1 Tax=Roseburia sp. TaxID=2049040 RepID=UPI003FF06FFA
MSEKTSAEVIIGGKVYKLSGYEEEGYLQKVAAYINNKINEYDGMEGLRRLPGDMKATLIQLNIADDYFKAKSQAEKLELEIEAKEKEIYNLKHDLISNQIKAESDEKTLKELEAQNKELLLNKARLEASLEEKLLGKLPDEKDSPKEPESEPEEKHEKSKEK